MHATLSRTAVVTPPSRAVPRDERRLGAPEAGSLAGRGLGARLLAALVYPRTVDEWLETVWPTYSSREVRARVVAVRQEARDVCTLVLRPNARWRGHRAGQWVTLTVELAGVRRSRTFSIASAPGGPLIELTVKAHPGGVVTPALVAGAALGKVVTLSPAGGDFVLPDPPPGHALFVSGGSGITPLMSMLRSLARRGAAGGVTFVHYAREGDEVIFGDELARLARAPGGPRVELRAGLFEPAAFAAALPDFDRRETWACGPAPMLEALRGAYEARGAAGRLRVERFSLASVAGAESGEVTFARSGASIAGRGTLLTLAERAGLSPPSGCRAGFCRTCTCRKLSGVTRDLRTGEMSAEAGVDVQLCATEPAGPVVIDL